MVKKVTEPITTYSIQSSLFSFGEMRIRFGNLSASNLKPNVSNIDGLANS